MKDQDRFQHLLDRFHFGHFSIEEYDEFFGLLASGEYDEIIRDRIDLDYDTLDLTDDAGLPPHIAQEIIRNIKLSDKNTADILPSIPVRKISWLKWVAAASIILTLITGTYYYTQEKSKLSVANYPGTVPVDQLLKTKSNDKILQLVLSDGSMVTLQPNSTIYYSKDFAGKKREVVLEGEAFFTVKRDPSKPFLVYYHNIVTKVLGTSFNVRTLARTNNFEVAVKTGKVQVYENEKFVKKGNLAKTAIITPNQRVVYNSAVEIFEKSLVDQPAPIVNRGAIENKTNKGKKETFVYNRNKLVDIFNDLSEQYGIEIIPENENFNNCLFTGDLSSQDLFTKLKIICLTINASYETIGTQIIVKGKGCAVPKSKLH